jgi:hypothetical protein
MFVKVNMANKSGVKQNNLSHHLNPALHSV